MTPSLSCAAFDVVVNSNLNFSSGFAYLKHPRAANAPSWKPDKINFNLPGYEQISPIAKWGLNINKKTIEVDTERFETNQKGIYAVGDICNYAGKLKLILSGFHEGALAARACFKLARPDEKYRFEFTTSSKTIKNRLGVKEW